MMRPVSVMVGVQCTPCNGKGRLRKSEHDRNGELIKCPICRGSGQMSQPMPIDDFVRLLAEVIGEQPGDGRTISRPALAPAETERKEP